MSGKDEASLNELVDQLEAEDGCLWSYDIDDGATLGFTLLRIETSKNLTAIKGDDLVQPTAAQQPLSSPYG